MPVAQDKPIAALDPASFANDADLTVISQVLPGGGRETRRATIEQVREPLLRKTGGSIVGGGHITQPNAPTVAEHLANKGYVDAAAGAAIAIANAAAAAVAGLPTISSFSASLLSQTSAASWRTALGLGSAALQPATAFASSIHTHDADAITSGRIAPARLGTGIPSSVSWLRGDGTWASIPGGATTFLALEDTPGSYSGFALRAIRVNAAGNGLEFYTPSGGGVPLPTITPFAETLLDDTDAAAARSTLGVSNLQVVLALAGKVDNEKWRMRLVEPISFASIPSLDGATATVAATANATITVTRLPSGGGGGTTIATAVFAAGQSEATITQSAVTCAAGDWLEISGPATADDTLESPCLTLRATRG